MVGVFVNELKKRRNFKDMFMSTISNLTFLVLVFTPIELMSFNLFTNYSGLPPEQNVQDLTIEQINHPTDPYINYNLGVALYQSDKFDQAKSNFQRCLIHAKNDRLKERCYFNLGNSFYKNALSDLPINWQNKDTEVDQAKLGQAVQEIKDAIKNYEAVLDINKKNMHAKTNLEKSKEALRKLQEKIKQQQQNQQNKKDKQDQNQDQNKDQQQQNQDSQNQDNKNQESSGERKEGKDQQNQQQQPTQDKKDGSGKSGNNGENGDHEKSEQEKNNDEKQQDFKHDSSQSDQQNPQQQNSHQYGNQQEQQNQEQEKQAQAAAAQSSNEKQDSAKQKSMRAMLDNLQNYESNLQKARVMQKTQDTHEPLKSNQKPW